MIDVFYVEDMRIINAVEFKETITDASIFCIIVGKFSH